MKLISFLLGGIFFYPIVFQSAHSVRHHTLQHHSEAIHCCETDCANSVSLPSFSLPEDQNCPICEYHFSLTHMPLEATLTYQALDYHEISSTISEGFVSLCQIAQLPSRAPPVTYC